MEADCHSLILYFTRWRWFLENGNCLKFGCVVKVTSAGIYSSRQQSVATVCLREVTEDVGAM